MVYLTRRAPPPTHTLHTPVVGLSSQPYRVQQSNVRGRKLNFELSFNYTVCLVLQLLVKQWWTIEGKQKKQLVLAQYKCGDIWFSYRCTHKSACSNIELLHVLTTQLDVCHSPLSNLWLPPHGAVSGCYGARPWQHVRWIIHQPTPDQNHGPIRDLGGGGLNIRAISLHLCVRGRE